MRLMLAAFAALATGCATTHTVHSSSQKSLSPHAATSHVYTNYVQQGGDTMCRQRADLCADLYGNSSKSYATGPFLPR